MRVRHPYSLDEDAPNPDGTVHWGGRRDWSEVDDDGTFYVPDDRVRSFLDAWPTANGYDADDLLIREAAESGASADASGEDLCTVELAAGGTCGRERPCPYHD